MKASLFIGIKNADIRKTMEVNASDTSRKTALRLREMAKFLAVVGVATEETIKDFIRVFSYQNKKDHTTHKYVVKFFAATIKRLVHEKYVDWVFVDSPRGNEHRPKLYFLTELGHQVCGFEFAFQPALQEGGTISRLREKLFLSELVLDFVVNAKTAIHIAPFTALEAEFRQPVVLVRDSDRLYAFCYCLLDVDFDQFLPETMAKLQEQDVMVAFLVMQDDTKAECEASIRLNNNETNDYIGFYNIIPLKARESDESHKFVGFCINKKGEIAITKPSLLPFMEEEGSKST